MDKNEMYIIAIGASAGGMEAIHLLFDHTPEDGVSYVIIQHLSPDHRSFMAELLAKHSKLKIFVAENDMDIKPNCVYLMPKGKNMTIQHRRLIMTDSYAIQPNMAIDIFLNSLAEDQRDKSIAVILSGAGSDGTKGIAAIKKFGGMVIVQDPVSAKFNGMPTSAIQSGNADVILAPELIPNEIIAYLKRDQLVNNFVELTDNDVLALDDILDLIEQQTPLDFTDYKRPTILRRIAIQMAYHKVTTLEAYLVFLKANPPEIAILAQQFLISVTKFFRDKEAFEILSEKVIPEIIQSKLVVDSLKVWVVGCATGEEAYSMAILIREHLTLLKKDLEVKIFASDIDKSALRHASKGVYAASIASDVSEERLDKFFIKNENTYTVRGNIRKMVIFADHDIVKQPPYGKIDLISCRNLLIYMNPILQKRILASIHFCLNLGGYLFIGPSESLGELKKSFQEIDKKWKIYKSRAPALNLRDTTYNTPALNPQRVNPALDSRRPKAVLANILSESINQTFLEVSGYEAAICVDSDFMIVQSLGNYEKYLLPKLFNFNLLEMLPEELSIATSTTLRKSQEINKKVLLKEVKFKKDKTTQSVNVFVVPISADPTLINAVSLVLFSEGIETNEDENEAEHFQIEKHTQSYLGDLRIELAETKRQLKLANDSLDVSQDNISSYGEELISSNEEMQSTNEELQSVNEELQTVNNEYQFKIKELAELNDDLNNYFKSTTIGQLFVDKKLVVRKFTPSSVKHVNLKESDVGRSLSDISTNIKFANLLEDINEVIATSKVCDKEIQTVDDRWYQMIIMPYVRQQDNQNDGVVITFNDITELKMVQEKLYKINEDQGNFIYSASHDLKSPLANISGLIDFLKEAHDPEGISVNEIADLIGVAISKLKETINELSVIVRIENEINEVELINVNKLFEEVKLSIKDKLTEAKGKINIDLQVPEITFSKKNLRSIIFNLLSNSLKYRSPDRDLELTIKTEQSDEYIILSVQDNGLGLDPNNINDIFLKFSRKHNHVEGSGIGLYLVDRIITNSGGKIEVESELGKGTIFKVYFKQ
ncbi:CheR family methyltransferase [Cyclobacterium qasimii]|uniref:histidine kinase n=2 Tax=Cyclobacterium qasimii TaxID=1350429 RepID=S7VAJ4_9BACT|nr:CheR family methyltransferase [Cyclobacterium qasimii]EPR66582.1 Chemotaxis protein methyltransferase CheR [Cyclobacterium qasimii M12-11B]GEO22776.1 chemotaxis protein CheR [Cyclobacterium qasimii]